VSVMLWFNFPSCPTFVSDPNGPFTFNFILSSSLFCGLSFFKNENNLTGICEIIFDSLFFQELRSSHLDLLTLFSLTFYFYEHDVYYLYNISPKIVHLNL